MSLQVGNGSLGGTVFFQVGLCTPLRTMVVKDQIFPKITKQICLTLYFRNCTSYDCGFLVHLCKMPQSLFWNIFAWWDTIYWQSFNTIVQFGHNLGQNHSILCPRQLCLVIYSLKIVKYGIMGYNSYTKVAVNLPKKFPFWARQFVPNLGQNYATLCLMIYSPRIFLKFCGMIRYNIDRQK